VTRWKVSRLTDDVNLAAGGPAAVNLFEGQQEDAGPQAGAQGQRDHRLHAPKLDPA
jgi:hypothetical protein